jgi:hypothetical protein
LDNCIIYMKEALKAKIWNEVLGCPVSTILPLASVKNCCAYQRYNKSAKHYCVWQCKCGANLKFVFCSMKIWQLAI